MDLKAIWEDDMLSFIGFLVLILPIPFIYVLLDNSMVGKSSFTLTYYAFLGDAVLWFTIVVLSVVYSKVRNRGGEPEPGRM